MSDNDPINAWPKGPASAPKTENILASLRIPSLAELERMLVILAMVNHWGDKDAPPPVMN